MQAVQRHLEDVKRTLQSHDLRTYPNQMRRADSALDMIPLLRTVSREFIQDLFFRKTIGDAAIERLLCDMYKGNF